MAKQDFSCFATNDLLWSHTRDKNIVNGSPKKLRVISRQSMNKTNVYKQKRFSVLLVVPWTQWRLPIFRTCEHFRGQVGEES